MKVWQLEGPGREHLHLIEQPQPKPGSVQVLVRVEAVSLNYRDKTIIDGTYPMPVSFPLLLASDLGGEIVAEASGCTCRCNHHRRSCWSAQVAARADPSPSSLIRRRNQAQVSLMPLFEWDTDHFRLRAIPVRA